MHLRGLYAITPEPPSAKQLLLTQIVQAIRGGARIVQYRDKGQVGWRRLDEAQALLHLCRTHQVSLIINDDLDLACAISADGVHLGLHDPDPILARQRLGSKAIIGVSCYNRLDLAQNAQAVGADYVAFGRFFPSTTKPLAIQADRELLRLAKQTIHLPLVAIGGITPQNAASLIAAGADMLAVIGALFTCEDIQATAQAFTDLFSL